MIVVAIVAILAAVALPAYSDYITRGRIPDATSNLASLQVKMEQWFQDNHSYYGTGTNSTACAVGATITTSSQYFTFGCAPDTGPTGSAAGTTYTITATGVGAMAGFKYTIDQNGTRTTTAVQTANGWTIPTPGCGWVTKKGGVC